MLREGAIVLHSNKDSSHLGRVRESLVDTLRQQNRKIAILEGCGGGALCAALTNPGSTSIISGGATPYSREEKMRLGISQRTIDDYGEYSAETAMAMAHLAQRKNGTDLGIGVTGNLVHGQQVFVAYAMKGRDMLLTPITLRSQNRRLMKNEIVVNAFTIANALLHGLKPPFDIPLLNEPPDVLRSEYELLDEKASEVVNACRQNGLTVGTMESCTGLHIANAITNIEGCHAVFKGGFLAYNENVKAKLGVPIQSMAMGGVYSKEVAVKMAEAVIHNMGVDVAFTTTGVMDTWDTRPFHTDVEPGTISLAIAHRGGKTMSETIHIPVTTRDLMKARITGYVFDKFIKYLKEEQSVRTFNTVSNLVYGK